MQKAQLYRGTSSWTAEGWVGSFYPPGCKPAGFLQEYAKHFNTVEIDSTFYRIPSGKMVEQWRERTPSGFVFAAKLPQAITHEKVLVDAENDLKTFLRVMDLLGDKLGRLLFQFPYFNQQKFLGVGFFLERLQAWLPKLPKGYQWVVEARNKSWLSEKLYSVLRRHGVALALVDHAWMPRPHEYFEAGDPITADFTFIRWIGDRKGIEERTKVWNQTIIDRTEDLREWAALLWRLHSRGVSIFAYANNHYAGLAPAAVNLFRRLWKRDQAPRELKKATQAGKNLEFSF